MQVHGGGMPAAQGVAQVAQLRWAVSVLQVLGEFAELAVGEFAFELRRVPVSAPREVIADVVAPRDYRLSGRARRNVTGSTMTGWSG